MRLELRTAVKVGTSCTRGELRLGDCGVAFAGMKMSTVVRGVMWRMFHVCVFSMIWIVTCTAVCVCYCCNK